MAETVDKAAEAKQVATVTLTIDGRETTVPKGTMVLAAARALGIVIPTFCDHPKLKPVGVCRMCYVEVDKMPKLQISCSMECMDGMVVHTESDLVKRGRRAIIEFTLLNHPLDCPTCDKGGECDLQDLTFAHGIDESRFDFQKSRYRTDTSESTFDDLRIGPEIVLNRNRCILCMRCVRANKEAFGEFDLGSYERGNITQINAAPGGQVDNPFSGNLVEICPVGALTNTDWRYKIRVWLTQTVSSLCPFTSSGTNTLIYKEDHQQKIFRTTSRTNDAIDDGWLADVTRYGHQVVTSDDRLLTPLIRKDGRQVPATWEEALETIGARLTNIKESEGGVCIAGMASPSLDNATLYSFSKLFRTALGSNNIDYRLDYRMLPKGGPGAYEVVTNRRFSISAIDDADLVFTLGTDLLREHPNEYLRIRKAYSARQALLFVAGPYGVKHADIATQQSIYTVGTEEIFVNGVCLAGIEEKLVDAEAGAELKAKLSPSTAAEAAALCGVELSHLQKLARALVTASKVTLIGGEIISRSHRRDAIGAALCNLNRLFSIEKKGQIAVLARYANSRGAEMLGLRPEPGERVKSALTKLFGCWPEAEPVTTDRMMVNMRKEEIAGAIILGANPMMLYPDREFARESLERLDFLVVADLFETDTTAIADVVLPLASWLEYDGHYVNLEGRVQRANRAIKLRGSARPGYEIVAGIAQKLGSELFASTGDRDQQIDGLLALDHVTPWPDEFLEVAAEREEIDDDYPVPLFIGDDPHHHLHLTEKSTALTNFCAEAYLEMSASMAAKYDLSESDSVRVESPVGKVIIPIKVSPYMKGEVVFIPRNFSSTPINSLLMRKRRIDRVKITKVER